MQENRYMNEGIECLDVIKILTQDKDGFEGFMLGNIIKYIWRYPNKGGNEDLKKALDYLDSLIKYKSDTIQAVSPKHRSKTLDDIFEKSLSVLDVLYLIKNDSKIKVVNTASDERFYACDSKEFEKNFPSCLSEKVLKVSVSKSLDSDFNVVEIYF